MKQFILLSMLFIPLAGFGYDVSVYPEMPKAGEGFLLTISDNQTCDYEIVYISFRVDGGDEYSKIIDSQCHALLRYFNSFPYI
jgi:hypothetical protein